MASLDETARQQLEALGEFIKHQRTMAKLSLREMAARTNVSNPYLSQIERGLHEPSVRVLKAIATALNVSAESLLVQAGLLDDGREDGAPEVPSVEDAVRADTRLTDEQRAALLAVYRSYVAENAKKP
jgi:transcriptional regulator with XRE-family HTH domain